MFGTEFLTPREKEVMEHLCQGKTNNEIGADLHITYHTVKMHLDNIFRKLEVSNRTQAVVKWMQS